MITGNDIIARDENATSIRRFPGAGVSPPVTGNATGGYRGEHRITNTGSGMADIRRRLGLGCRARLTAFPCFCPWFAASAANQQQTPARTPCSAPVSWRRSANAAKRTANTLLTTASTSLTGWLILPHCGGFCVVAGQIAVASRASVLFAGGRRLILATSERRARGGAKADP